MSMLGILQYENGGRVTTCIMVVIPFAGLAQDDVGTGPSRASQILASEPAQAVMLVGVTFGQGAK